MAEFVRVLRGPVSIDGGVLRLVELSDGSGQVEIWSPHRKTWEPGGAAVEEVLRAGNTSEANLKRFGVPKKDWGIAGTSTEALW